LHNHKLHACCIDDHITDDHITVTSEKPSCGKACHNFLMLLLQLPDCRLRTQACLQLAMPSQQNHLQPELSVTPHRSRTSSPEEQHLQVQEDYIQQQTSPTKSYNWQQQQPRQTSGATDAELHMLCSTELKSAIMTFLQQHTDGNGQDFVLLGNSSGRKSHSGMRSSRQAALLHSLQVDIDAPGDAAVAVDVTPAGQQKAGTPGEGTLQP
jgi:hypothetical protein